MEIIFTKGAGKYDQMRAMRGGAEEIVDCPKQRIVPHDMVHYAVEISLRKRGFLSRVANGEAAAFRMAPESESDGVERLVEVFQGDAWSGGNASPKEMIDLYLVTCAARECPPLPVTGEDILAIRKLLGELDAKWQALAIGDSMTLRL